MPGTPSSSASTPAPTRKKSGPKPGYNLPPGWRGTVLAMWSEGHSLSACARELGCDVHTLMRQRDENIDGFADDLNAAGLVFSDKIRDEIVERAFDRDFKGSDMWLDRLAQWRLPETKLALAAQEEARTDNLASALTRLDALLAARRVQAALPGGSDGVAVDADS